MVDNIELIKDLLIFKSEDDFYYLQILQRKKENPELGSNSRVIKNYYIKSLDHLLERYDEIKTLCNVFNARASLRLNKRSFERVAFKTLENIANTMQNREYKHIMKSYDRASGLLNNEKNKKWIIDVDQNEMIYIDKIIKIVNSLQPEGDKIITKIPSKTGVHIITSPFNVTEFNHNIFVELNTTLEIHKDNPINLFIS